MLAYRVGFPGWKIAARLGMTLKVRVTVLWDNDAQVFVATSEDFLPEFGCVAESETWDGLKEELKAVLYDAFESIFGKTVREPVFDTILRFA